MPQVTLDPVNEVIGWMRGCGGSRGRVVGVSGRFGVMAGLGVGRGCWAGLVRTRDDEEIELLIMLGYV